MTSYVLQLADEKTLYFIKHFTLQLMRILRYQNKLDAFLVQLLQIMQYFYSAVRHIIFIDHFRAKLMRFLYSYNWIQLLHYRLQIIQNLASKQLGFLGAKLRIQV